MEQSGFYNFDDWAKVSCDDAEDDQGSSSSSSAEVLDAPSAKFFIRRDSSDSVEIMSLENDEDADVQELKCKDDESTHSSHKMCCSTCSTLMNQSLSSSMVHVKMEEIETQTDVVDLGCDDTIKVPEPPQEPLFEAEEEESQLEMALDRIAEFIHHHGHQLIFIPTHLLFALLVLSAAHLTGIARIEALESSSHRTPMDGDVLPTISTTSTSTVTTSATNIKSGQMATTTIRELQSPEWLDRLSSLLDDLSSELAAVDSQISVVERQLDLFDEQQQLGGLGNKQQLFVVDAYRQLVERQRQTARLLDKINSVLNIDRQSRREPATLLDVRLKLVDLAGDFVQLNSRLTEVTFANKRRHISIVKRASTERHRQETAFLASLIDRVRNSDAAQSVPTIDDKSASCRRLFRPVVREEQNTAQDVVECLSRSRALAAATWRQMNMSLEQERLATIRYRNRALFAEMTVSDLREEVSFLNRTIFLQEQLQKAKERQLLKEQQAKRVSLLQCFSQLSDFSSFSELLQRPEYCVVCDLIDRLCEQFVRLLNSISSALLNGSTKEWSTKTVLNMLASTFQVLSNTQPAVKSRPAPVIPKPQSAPVSTPPPTTWASRLRSKIKSVKSTISNAYDKLKRSFRASSNVTFPTPSVCPSIEANYEQVRSRVESLQHDRLYYDASVLNAVFKDVTSLQDRVENGWEKCLDQDARRFLKCNLAWGHRMMRLFRWPVCADRLPSECKFMPWQKHLMGSIELTSPSYFEVHDNSTVMKMADPVRRRNELVPRKSTSLSLLPLWQYFVKTPAKKQFQARKMDSNRRGDDGSNQECTYMFLSRPVKDIVVVRYHHFAPSPPYLPTRTKIAPVGWCQVPERLPSFFEQGPQLPALPALLPAPNYSISDSKKEFLPSCQSQLVANNLKSDAFLSLVKRMHA